jgi:hypothetical protein
MHESIAESTSLSERGECAGATRRASRAGPRISRQKSCSAWQMKKQRTLNIFLARVLSMCILDCHWRACHIE